MSPQLHIQVESVQPVTTYRVYRTTNGIDRHPIGPSWTTPRAASHYLALIDQMPDVTPIRSAGESPHLPSPGVGDSPAELIG